MTKLIKYLKPFTLSIIAIVILLFVQASSDLSLPAYMSKIVDVGISQKGIETSVPNAIRESEFSKITSFIKSDEDKAILINSYKLIDSSLAEDTQYNDIVDKYPLLKTEPLYILQKNYNKKLSTIMALPEALIMMEKEAKNTMNIDAEKLMSTGKIDDTLLTILNKKAISFVENEYTAIGVDIPKLQTSYIINSGIIMLLIALLSMVAVVVVTVLASRVAASLAKKLRSEVFVKVVNFSRADFDKFSTSTLITRCTNDISQIQNLMVIMLRMVFYAPILGIGGIFKVLQVKSGMTFIIIIAVCCIILLVSTIFTIAVPKYKMVQKLVDKVNLITRESLTGMMVVRAFGNQKYEEKRFDDANINLTKTNMFVSKMMNGIFPIMTIIMNYTTIAILWYGSKKVDMGIINVGDVMAFIQYAMQIMMSFLMLSMVSVLLPRASVSASRIAEVLETEISINDPQTPQTPDVKNKGTIEFKNVFFKYPDAQEYVLEDISFLAKPGQTTAFIGSTGSGKSTVINLIPRFYDIDKGSILVDSVDVRNMTQKALRDKIGYIPQKGLLFSGTIESNIKYGNESLSDEDMDKVAKISQSYDFINEKEEKYNEKISQSGSNVSGGQRQRLSIARALAKNPQIFIFDDSFSALDYKTDRVLREALNKELSDATVLIVAQRISTIRNAEQIIVMDEGKIVGKGTHKELMTNCEVYKEIANSQLSKEELDHE